MAVTISPGFSAVVKRSTKNLSAGIFRAPFGPFATTVAPRATRTVGKSAAGSACAMEPPIVPRLRTWMSPICEAASARIGQDFFTSGRGCDLRVRRRGADLERLALRLDAREALDGAEVDEGFRPTRAGTSWPGAGCARRRGAASPCASSGAAPPRRASSGRKYSKLEEYIGDLLLPGCPRIARQTRSRA